MRAQGRAQPHAAAEESAGGRARAGFRRVRAARSLIKAAARTADVASMRVRPPVSWNLRLVAAMPAALLLACGDAAETPEPLAAASSERANEPPRIVSVALDPAAPRPGGTVRAVVEVADPDGDPVKATYEWKLRGEPAGGGMPKLVLHDAARGDELELTVVASDGRAESPPEIARAYLGNQPPEIARLLIGPALEISAGTAVSVEPEASDPDGDELSFRHEWRVNGEPVAGASGAVFETSGLARGDVVVVEVRAHDGSDEGEPLASPPIRVVNAPPRVESRPGPAVAGAGFRYRVEATDPDGDAPLQFELEEAPAGMSIGAGGEITWMPTPDQAGRHRIRVVVDDRNGGRVSHAFEVQVGSPGPPAAVEP